MGKYMHAYRKHKKSCSTHCICLHSFVSKHNTNRKYLLYWWHIERHLVKEKEVLPQAIVSSRLHYAAYRPVCIQNTVDTIVRKGTLSRVLYFAENLLVISSIRRKASFFLQGKDKARFIRETRWNALQAAVLPLLALLLPISIEASQSE